MNDRLEFKKLHRLFGNPVYVAVAHACAVYATDNGTVVRTSDANEYLVREAPEEILGRAQV